MVQSDDHSSSLTGRGNHDIDDDDDDVDDGDNTGDDDGDDGDDDGDDDQFEINNKIYKVKNLVGGGRGKSMEISKSSKALVTLVRSVGFTLTSLQEENKNMREKLRRCRCRGGGGGARK